MMLANSLGHGRRTYTKCRNVFATMQGVKFCSETSKSFVAYEEITALGSIVNLFGFKPHHGLYAKVEDWHFPRNIKEMRSFLGLANYFRDHVPHYVDLVDTLQSMITNWREPTPQDFEEFEQIKRSLMQTSNCMPQIMKDLFIYIPIVVRKV